MFHALPRSFAISFVFLIVAVRFFSSGDTAYAAGVPRFYTSVPLSAFGMPDGVYADHRYSSDD